ncbi:hypothetical protein NW762_010496 [Fusarium torreyae]|uniref:Uncharacterized protein n=1 Tax=Fusarium torreyae TaxID=1237075 RepID=A0A9W8RUU3_9HYPO|nr:hypothetical protein NW762_010496 [Fusarium torreyae]
MSWADPPPPRTPPSAKYPDHPYPVIKEWEDIIEAGKIAKETRNNEVLRYIWSVCGEDDKGNHYPRARRPPGPDPVTRLLSSLRESVVKREPDAFNIFGPEIRASDVNIQRAEAHPTSARRIKDEPETSTAIEMTQAPAYTGFKVEEAPQSRPPLSRTQIRRRRQERQQARRERAQHQQQHQHHHHDPQQMRQQDHNTHHHQQQQRHQPFNLTGYHRGGSYRARARSDGSYVAHNHLVGPSDSNFSANHIPVENAYRSNYESNYRGNYGNRPINYGGSINANFNFNTSTADYRHSNPNYIPIGDDRGFGRNNSNHNNSHNRNHHDSHSGL